jgi:hypothetical protein
MTLKGGALTPQRALELFQNRGLRAYELAYNEHRSLSHWLTREIGFDKERGLDGFEQLLAEADITTISIPEEGIWADTCGRFLNDDNLAALFPEFIARQHRKVAGPKTRGDQIYMSGDLQTLITGNVTGAYTTTRPLPLLEPAIPLEYLVAFTTGISGNLYQALYLTEPSAADTRMVRIAETAEIPRSKLTGGKSAIQLFKTGRALEVSYEDLRRTPLDRIGFHIQRIGVQSQIDKVNALLDIAISGDGNDNAATSTDISDLDPAATGGSITVLGWLTWKATWNTGAYRLTGMLVRQATAVKLQMLSMGNANIPFAVAGPQLGIGGFVPLGNAQRTGDDVAYGVTEDVGATQIVGFDTRQAIEQVFEVGANINETARYISRQTELLTMTEVVGYAKQDQNAVRILNLA